MWRRIKTLIAALLLAVVLFLASAPAARAQGCSMCRTGASAQSEAGKRALNIGILLLLSPTLLIFGGLLFVAYKRREGA
jgi:hypothetical protein